MRLANSILHLALVWLLFSAANLDAQQNGNLPQLVSGLADTDTTITAANHLVFGCLIYETSASCPDTASMSDSSGVLPSITTGTVNCMTGGNSNPFQPQLVVAPFWGISAGAGNVALTPTTGGGRRLTYMPMTEFNTNNLTLDAQNSNNATAPTNPSIAVTSTQQNDLVSTCMATADQPFTQFTNMPVPTVGNEFSSSAPGSFSDLGGEITWFNAGAAGAQATSYLSTGGTHGFALSTVAFKSNIGIAASALPDGGKGTAYFACLLGFGGTGAYTFSITSGSLQTGLSLATTGSCPGTNSTINGTPTVASTNTITFQISDGTHTATRALNLTIGAGLQTIFIRSATPFSGIGLAPQGGAAQAGDSAYIHYYGDDTHGGMGFIVPPLNITDQCGDVFVRVLPIAGGVFNGTILTYTTKVTCSGTLTINYNGRQGDPLAGVTIVCSGCQPGMDPVVIQQSSPGSTTSTTLSTSFVSQVPNMKVLSIAVTDCGTGAGCTASTTTAGFNSIATANTLATFSVYGQDIPTATTTSATTSFSVPAGMSGNAPMMAMIGIRPAALTGALPAGEKIRRRMN